ncbi:MAG: hypothetical protein CMJ47_04040 [Planctomyces sp.]|nr:hypothetical protein [Planctomyces sp.]
MNQDDMVLAVFLNKKVVLDMQSMFVCLGTLTGADHRYFILTDADVHDLRETTTTRERYVLDAHVHGINANRSRALIMKSEVVSLSLLDDVVA